MVLRAAKIGDDALQRGGGGAVVPESFTHGSSAQRQRWFNNGLNNGGVKACDTFSAKIYKKQASSSYTTGANSYVINSKMPGVNGHICQSNGVLLASFHGSHGLHGLRFVQSATIAG